MNKRISMAMFSVGCLCFSIADIYLVDKKIITPNSPYTPSVIKHKKYLDAQLESDEIINFLNNDKSKYRVLPIGELADNRLVAFNIESATGYHPAKLASYELLNENTGINDNVLRMLNIKYILSTQKYPDDQAAGLSLKRVKSGKYYNNFKYKDVYVYEYLNLGKRAQFLSDLGFVDSRDDGYNLLKTSRLDIIKDSFISKDDYEDSMELISYNKNSTLQIKKWSPNKIIIKTNTIGPLDKKHFVLLSEIYFPYGWKIEGDNDIKIIEVNNLLRGFFVSNGENETTLSFEPSDLKYGSIVTYSSFILILFMFFISYTKRYNERV